MFGKDSHQITASLAPLAQTSVSAVLVPDSDVVSTRVLEIVCFVLYRCQDGPLSEQILRPNARHGGYKREWDHLKTPVFTKVEEINNYNVV